MINDAGSVALREFVNRAARVAGPDDFHRRMRGVRAELQMDILRGVKNGFAQRVAERGDKFPRLVGPAHGEAEMVKVRCAFIKSTTDKHRWTRMRKNFYTNSTNFHE